MPQAQMPVAPAAPAPMSSAPSRSSYAGRRRRSLFSLPFNIVVGGVIGLTLGYFAVYYLRGEDMFRLFPRRDPLLARWFAGPAPTTDRTPRAAPVERPSAAPRLIAPPVAAAPRTGSQTLLPPDDKPGTASEPAFVTPPLNTAPLPGIPPDGILPRGKLPQPSAKERQKMLAGLQSIYKAEFDRGNKPEGRGAFVAFLIETARKLQAEPTAQFVLFREAYDRAIKQDDFVAAADAIDELERTFDVDGFRSRLHLLNEAVRGARSPDERQPLVQFALDMADYAQATQRIEDLPKLAITAEAATRATSKEMRAKVAARCQELKRIADDFAHVTAARQRLEQDPADAAASLIDGKYRCFALGDWPAGLKLLAQSNHTALAAAARQDLAGPSDGVKPAAIGDLWFEIGATELTISGAYARAQHWYAQAALFAVGLEKVKIEKRSEQIAAMNLPARLFESNGAEPQLPRARLMLTQQKPIERTEISALLTNDTPHTAGWTVTPGFARSDGKATWARLQSPVSPAGEYQTALRITRSRTLNDSTFGPFVIGLPSLRSSLLVVIDYPIAGSSYASFLALSGYKRLEENPTFRLTGDPAPRLKSDRTQLLVCSVKANEILVQLDNDTLIEYRGDMMRLAMPSEWAFGNSRTMFIGSHQGGFYVNGWNMAPLDTGTVQ
jgi:hypothetical protein